MINFAQKGLASATHPVNIMYSKGFAHSTKNEKGFGTNYEIVGICLCLVTLIEIWRCLERYNYLRLHIYIKTVFHYQYVWNRTRSNLASLGYRNKNQD